MTEAIITGAAPPFPCVKDAEEWIMKCAREIMAITRKHNPMFFFLYYERNGVMVEFRTSDKTIISKTIRDFAEKASPRPDFGIFVSEAWVVEQMKDDPVGFIPGELKDNPRSKELLILTVSKRGKPDTVIYYNTVRDDQGNFIELMHYKTDETDDKSIGRFVRLLG